MAKKAGANERHNVIVIGAGLSGLAAALKLHKAGANVCVLEARDRVGGRTATETHNGTTVDVGGAYVGPSQNRILRLADEFKVETYKIYNPPEGKNVLMLNGSRGTYSGAVPTLNPFALLDMNNLLVTLENERVLVPPGEAWKAPNALALDKMTVQQWIDQKAWTSDVKKLTTLLIEIVLCVEPSEVSVLNFLALVNASDGVLRVSEVEQGAQERKFLQGAQAISIAMAALLGMARVKLNMPVATIAQTGDGVKVTTRSGEVFQADYAILAIPPALYSKINFEPALPLPKQMIAARLPMGCIIKTVMHYPRPFWRDAGLTGSFVSDEGPISATFDDTKPDGSHAGIMGFLLANNMRQWVQATPEERKKAICDQYAKTFGNAEALKPIGYVEHNWVAEEFSGGCYMGVAGPQVLTAFGHSLRTPHERVHIAGTESATLWGGYMDGAVQSGERAAHEILVRLHQAKTPGIQSPGAWVETEPPNKHVIALPLGPSWFERHLPGPGTVLAAAAVAVSAAAYYAFSLWQ